MLNKLRLRLRALLFKSRMEDELNEEVRFHLEREIEENILRGMTPEEARYAAIRSFGGVERVKEESRDARGVRILEDVWHDLRHGARMLMKQPGFTAAAILSLALGIGAATAIFSFVDAVLLRPLPYPQPDRLVQMREVGPRGGQMRVAEPNYGDVRDIDNLNYTIVGVMPPGFDFPNAAEVWIASELFPPHISRTAHNWNVIGRLGNGVTLAQAKAEVSALGRRLKQQFGEATDAVDFALIPQLEFLVRDVKTGLWLIGGAVALLLLIACANVANLLLAQVTARRQELSVRQALGASRFRLARQFVTECVLLTLIGAGLGGALSFLGVDLLTGLVGDGLPRVETVRVDLRVLTFALGLALLTGLALGLVPALRSGGKNLQADLKGMRETPGAATQRLQGAFAVLQVALTMILLVGAGLLLRSFYKLLQNDLGFRTESAVVVRLSLPDYALDPKQRKKFMQLYDRLDKGEKVDDNELLRFEENANEKRMALFYRRLFERLQALPGVTAVGGVTSLPLAGQGADGTFVIDNDPAQKGHANYRLASPGYFAAMGIPLLRGRLFETSDQPGAQHVAVISQSLARKRWPNEDPIGKLIQFGNMDGDLRLLRVVGVVGDVREQPDQEAQPTVYANSVQRPQPTDFTIVVRGTAQPSALRQTLQTLDRGIPATYRTLSQVFSDSLNRRRFNLALFGSFAIVALLLAVMGIYSVLAHTVTRQTREIGLRIALGAQAADVLKLIVAKGMSLTGIGVALGIAGALALRQFVASLLYGVTATDSLTFASIALLLAVVAFVACCLPARRATKVNPMIALRSD